MRLMRADVRSYTLKRATTVRSARAGTKNEYAAAGTVYGHLSALSDKFLVAMYGDRSATMYQLICTTGTDITKGDRVVLHDGDYTVVSVTRYGTHITAALERTGALSNGNG